MNAMNLKLVREAWHLRGQLLSIALVVAAGVMTVVTLRGTYVSLATSLDMFYRDYRFGDVFAGLSRAPVSLAAEVAEIPGVASVHTRVREVVNLDVPGLSESAVGLLLSIPPEPQATLNDIHVVSGRYIDPAEPDEVLVSESFATANGLTAGDAVGAVINGRWRRLEIAGVAISPDYIGEIAPGTVFPDDRRFAIMRMNRDALAAATGMEDAFNEISLELAPSGSEAAVIAALDRMLEPHGGLGAYGRDRHESHQAVMGELEQNRVTGTMIPAIFLGVAAFLLNVVLSRIVGTQREQIAALKAFGYSNIEVGLHYLRFAMLPVLAGALFGTAIGVWLGGALTQLYGAYFRFPRLEYVIDVPLIAIAAGISVAAAALGALGAVRAAVRLPPAEAMRPEAPTRFRPGPLERMGLGRWLSASAQMILRNVERRPARSMLAALGVAFAVALLVVSMFFYDAITRMIDVQFDQAQREDLALYFADTRPLRVRYDLAQLDGVTHVELFRSVPVRLSSGHVDRTTVLTGLQMDGSLRRIVDQKRRLASIPRHGVLLSEALADILHVAVGDTLHVAVLDGRRSQFRIPIAATVDDLFGLNAYVDLATMYSLIGEPEGASGAFLRADASVLTQLNEQIKRLPVVVSAYAPETVRQTFDEMMDETLMISVTFLVVLSGILAIGIIYNGARIALSERGRELASLRVLGFTRREVAVLLLGEQGAITLLAIPLGWVIGIGFGALVLSLFDMERYRIPMVVSNQTYIFSGLIAIASAVLAGLAVRRRVYRLDLIGVLKTRE